MRRKEKDGVIWLEFDLLADMPGIKHGVFLRHGGFSTGAYGSLNFSPYVGDDPLAVERNHAKARDIMQVKTLATAYQCHGTQVHEIKTNPQTDLKGDALMTACPGIGLTVYHADCQAAIIYDPVQHAVANVHAGWRGNVQNIYAEAISAMQRTYQSKPQDLLVCISPSLGPGNAQFINYRTELPEHFWPYQVKPFFFDLWEIGKMQLIQSGILPQHIEIAEMCTYGNPQDCFSYRQCKVSGRHGTIVALL